ncbi:hypothetical protein ACTFIY_004901 [Dictyostelium cf. discoideum]
MVNSDKEEQNLLFYKVWSNIVIFKNIFGFVRLYKKNERVIFKSKKELLEYPEREFIHSLVYTSNELLEVGDLPIGCVLKEVELTNYIHTNIHGSKIPFGVEKLEFLWSSNNSNLPKTQISTFPSSLKTLNGIFLGKNKHKKKQDEKEQNEKEKNEKEQEENCRFIIPSNINTVYLNDSPNISGVDKGRGYVVLSKGLKDISFDCNWENDGVCLRKGDFPDGIEILTMSGYPLKNITSNEILPNSIKDLSMSYGRSKYSSNDDDVNKEPGKFDVLPPAIEKLYIYNHCDFKKDSLLNTLTSLKELGIYNCEWNQLLIEAGTLPPNITTLSLENLKSKIKIDVIPIGVKHLELSIRFSDIDSNSIEIGAIPSTVESLSIDSFITQPEILPPSLTHLTYGQTFDYDDDGEDGTLDDIQFNLSLLPISITSLTLVWGNIVIFKNIFGFVRLFKKNERVVFKSKKELLEYPEREFIHSLVYSSNQLLEVGDLPIGCVLKEVELTTHIHININGSKIPFGVEKLDFTRMIYNRVNFRTQISTFPSSLKTINGIILKKYEHRKKHEEEVEEEQQENSRFIIPSNINTVYLNDSPNISGVDKGRGYVVLSKGLKEISFGFDWKNENLCLRKGDFPDGIEVLNIPRFPLKNIINEDILPNSIKELSISYGKSKYRSEYADADTYKESGKFDVLPPAIEKLYIYNNYNIKKDSLLNTLTSIKELRIYNQDFKRLMYEAGSLPPNITTLSFRILKNSNSIEIGAIPSTVETLSIDSFITLPELFPPSLTHLIYTQFYIEDFHTLDQIVSYFSILPKSITSLTLGISFKHLNLNFPPSINKIEFKENGFYQCNKNKNN